MRQIIKNPCPIAPAQEEFLRIERELNGQIPSDYRKFITYQNGGFPVDPEGKGFWHFNFRDESNPFAPNRSPELNKVFSVGIGDKMEYFSDALTAYRYIREDDKTYPIDMLPIAETAASAIVGLSLGPMTNGQVHLCPVGMAYRVGAVILAPSFTGFLNSLYLRDPDEGA
jgi:SMI1-KNR4 cell-wall